MLGLKRDGSVLGNVDFGLFCLECRIGEFEMLVRVVLLLFGFYELRIY